MVSNMFVIGIYWVVVLTLCKSITTTYAEHTDRPMTTSLFLLRCKQLGLTLTEPDLLTIGVINDMFTEK